MNSIFWLGTEQAFEAYTKATPLAEAKRKEWEAKAESDDEPDFPPLYSLVGDTGVIRIEGSLIPGEAGFYRYFGVTGYEDIKAAVLQGLADKGAKRLLIYSNSGGGSVAGVEDAADFIAQVATLKPMSAYSEFSASAAYWLTSAAGHITTSNTSVNGSIGVLRVVTEYTKRLEKDGVTATVMRAGRYKALANPYEPLSEDGKAEIQAKLDDLYQIFVDMVAKNRGTTPIIADQVMGQGREFLGKRGLEVGLVDAIGDFNSAIEYAKANQRLATKKTSNFAAAATSQVAQAGAVPDNAATPSKTGTEMHLTPEQLAAIAAGASVQQVTGQAEAATTDTAAAAEATTEATTAAVEDSAEDAAALKAEVETLKAELAAAQAEAGTATAQAQTLASQVAALQADLQSAGAVIQASIQSMHVALGKKVDTSKMATAELIAEHASAKTAMLESFKVGGVARSTASTQEKPAAPFIAPRTVAAAKNMFNPR